MEMLKRVAWYEGIDPSAGFLTIAKWTNPNGLFAFASLLHVNRTDLPKIFQKPIKRSILAEFSLFQSKKILIGERMFYYYNASLIEQLTGPSFEQVYDSREAIGHTDWFTITLKKV